MPLDLAHTSVHLLVVAASLALFVIAGRAPAAARLLFVAALATTAVAAVAATISAPDALTALGHYAPVPQYRALVDRVLAPHPRLALTTIAAAAGLCAIGLATAGRGASWAATATGVVLVAIVPFGAGTAFPAPLFAAVSLWLVSRSPGLLDQPALRWRRPVRAGQAHPQR